MSCSFFNGDHSKAAEFLRTCEYETGDDWIKAEEAEGLLLAWAMSSIQTEQRSEWYMDWYEKEHCGGRHPMTIGQLRSKIESLPDDMPVKVSHQHDRHSIGINDPIAREQEISVVVGMTNFGAPIHGPHDPPLRYFIFE